MVHRPSAARVSPIVRVEDCSPPIIVHAEPSNFKAIVQQLTGIKRKMMDTSPMMSTPVSDLLSCSSLAQYGEEITELLLETDNQLRRQIRSHEEEQQEEDSTSNSSTTSAAAAAASADSCLTLMSEEVTSVATMAELLLPHETCDVRGLSWMLPLKKPKLGIAEDAEEARALNIYDSLDYLSADLYLDDVGDVNFRTIL